MENFSLESFNPTNAQLIIVADGYKGLTIAKDGIEVVKEAKKDLQSKRIFISKVLKLDRDKAIKYQKDNIAKEKELIGIISPVEAILDKEIEDLATQEEMNKRKEFLPIMREELEKIGLASEYDDDFLLTMNFSQFMSFLNSEKARLFEAEMEKKRVAEAEAKRVADLKDAEERGRLQAEQKAKEEADAKEEREKKAKADQEEADRKAQAQLEANEKYNAWLVFNGFNESDCMITDNGEEKVMRRKVSSYKK